MEPGRRAACHRRFEAAHATARREPGQEWPDAGWRRAGRLPGGNPEVKSSPGRGIPHMRTARMITRIAPVITLLLLVPASPVSPAGRRVRDSGRPPAPRAPIERVTSELVLIETYVTGADGRPIPDLTSDDFVLLVDGRRSPIASIEYRETAVPSVPPQATQSAVTSVSSSRRFVLFFEDGISAPDGLEAARSAAERFLSSGLGPEDQVAVAAFDRRLRILHGFTS